MPDKRSKIVCIYHVSHESILPQAIDWLMRNSNGNVTGNILRNHNGSDVKLIVEGPYSIIRKFGEIAKKYQRFLEPSVNPSTDYIMIHRT